MQTEIAMTDSTYHVPVMADEVVRLLDVRAGSWVVDGTVGGGGHAERIVAAGARLIAIDRDLEAIRAATARLGSDVIFVHAPFDALEEALSKAGVSEISGALLDLGVSSHQLDADGRGFSFLGNGPLDMRMDPSRDVPASELVNTLSHGEIAKLLREYGEEKNGGRIAGIISERDLIYCLREHGPEVLDWPVSRVMSSPAITAEPQTEVLSALATMTQRRIRHLPIVERGAIVGIVSIGDLVKYRMECIEAEAEAMRSYIQSA